jgi:ribosomal protein S8
MRRFGLCRLCFRELRLRVKSLVLERQAGKNNMNYPTGDFLIRLKNASLAGHKSVEANSNKLIKAIAKLLEKEGFLTDVVENKGKLSVKLAFRKKSPVLVNIKLVSKPGLRIYLGGRDRIKKRTIIFHRFYIERYYDVQGSIEKRLWRRNNCRNFVAFYISLCICFFVKESLKCL